MPLRTWTSSCDPGLYFLWRSFSRRTGNSGSTAGIPLPRCPLAAATATRRDHDLVAFVEPAGDLDVVVALEAGRDLTGLLRAVGLHDRDGGPAVAGVDGGDRQPQHALLLGEAHAGGTGHTWAG